MTDNRPIRVLCVTAWDGASGVMTVMRSLAEQLAPQGVTFASFCFGGFAPDTPWHQVTDDRYSHRDQTLTELLCREPFDAVHVIDTAMPRPFDASKWIERAHYRGGIVAMFSNPIRVIRPADRVHVYVAGSTSTLDLARQDTDAPVRLVPNGIDTQVMRAIDRPTQDRPILGWVGRANDREQKDVHGFMHLAAELNGDGYDFWIADGGDNLDEIRLRDWFGDDRIRYRSRLSRHEMVGFYNDVAHSGGAMVSTSTFEQLPMSMLEAIACRCPVILPRVPGMELLEENDAAVMYDRRHGLAGIRAALDRLADPAFRAQQIDRADRVLHERFTSEAMAAGYLVAYREAIAAAAQAGRPSVRGRLASTGWSMALRAKRSARWLKGRIAQGRSPQAAATIAKRAQA